MVSNRDVLAMLSELVTLTTLDEESPQSFKVRAYENARLGLEAHGSDFTALTVGELTKIKGVGKATANKIRELVDHGSVAKIEALRQTYPPVDVGFTRTQQVEIRSVQHLDVHGSSASHSLRLGPRIQEPGLLRF